MKPFLQGLNLLPKLMAPQPMHWHFSIGLVCNRNWILLCMHGANGILGQVNMVKCIAYCFSSQSMFYNFV